MSGQIDATFGARPDGQHLTAARAIARPHGWTIVVGSVALGWAVALFLVARDRYAEFRYARYDLGNMVQAVWSTAHGRLLENTHGLTGEQTSRLGNHVDPILAAIAPLWLVFPSPLLLAAIQVAAVASGALPLFWLARKHLASTTAAGLLALTYLAYPWTAWNALDVFHPVALAIPLFIFCVWFLDTDRLLPFAFCGALVLMTGELMGLTVAALGIWYALGRERRRAGFAIAACGAGWTLIALTFVVPAFSNGENLFHGAYDHVGGSPTGLLKTTVTDPGTVLGALTDGRDFLYVALLAAPLGGVFLLAPGLAAVALPQLAVNLLAARQHTTDPHVHYVAGILPFLFVAAAVGLGRLAPRAQTRVAGLVLTIAASSAIAVGPWPGTLLGAANWDSLGTLDTSPAHVRALEKAVALVPDDAALSSTNRVGSQLAARERLYSVPQLGRANWVVADSGDTWVPESFGGTAKPDELAAFVARLERRPGWEKVFEESGVVVFRKVER